ncbi:ABC transporter ATP-binding protein, partial [Neorhizobium sp. T25_13]|uniref:ABC transporter ATP-binding protein n=1 Tax=Neorhizobium sp. T25_13 TaxID=2093830 RepID=UPI000CF8FB31
MNGEPIDILGIEKQFGDKSVVSDVSLSVKAGEFLSLLGPSGSGKTTLLMMIAGFEFPNSGQIRVGSRDITYLAPNRRAVGMVFQKYALFPHMTVEQNIAFPLRMRSIATKEINRRVSDMMGLVQLTGFEGRYPQQLSGGQQQRVAVARALIAEPPVLLMDEPLSALDKKLRETMQIEIKRIQNRVGVTVVYVTHDQEEALTMSDRIAVMSEGRLVQVGSPHDLYQRPATSFVAEFVGKMNFLKGEFVGSDHGTFRVRIAGNATLPSDLVLNGEAEQYR